MNQYAAARTRTPGVGKANSNPFAAATEKETERAFAKKAFIAISLSFLFLWFLTG